MAEEAADKGQEELRNVLASWQACLAHIGSPHTDMAAAAAELGGLREATAAHMSALEEHAAAVDQGGKRDADPPSKELLAYRDTLRSKVEGKQVHLKTVIDRLRGLQDDICVLTCVTPSLEVSDKITSIDRAQHKNGKTNQQLLS
mmetsp:Transcript_23713/g.46027  ORF Transcript_23713/g.46027 Transcript_23713/m.46027 type:complete len:145 (+) Transcript_23713:64-498(+)